MSIPANINTLTEEIKQDILKKLTFKVEKPRNVVELVDPYYIDEKSMTIHLPFAYARKNYFLQPKPRTEYQSLDDNVSFTSTLRDYQKDVKSEIITILNSTGSCVLALHVGYGKTVLAIYLAMKLKLKTIILMNRIGLAEQWVEQIKKYSNASVVFVKPKMKFPDDADICVMNASTVPKIFATNPASLLSFGTVICDELHLICAKTLYKSLFHLNPRYLIGLSATPHRPDGYDRLIDIYFGVSRVVKELKRKHTIYAIFTGLELKFTYGYDGRIDWNSLLNSQAEHPLRNDMIVQIIEKFPTRNFLVLVKRVAHGQLIYDKLIARKISATNLLGTKQEFDKEARVLIATTSKVGVGFSHDKMDALILASDAEEYFIQYLGRVFRTPTVEPVIFDIVDAHSTLKRHFSTRKKIYKDVGGIIHTISNIDEIKSI